MKTWIMLGILVALILLASTGCSNPAQNQIRNSDSIRADVTTLTNDLNGYFESHDLTNTASGELVTQASNYYNGFTKLTKEAEALQQKGSNPSLDEVVGLAREAASSSNGIVTALGQDPTNTAEGFTALKNALVAWSQFSDKINMQGVNKLADKEKTKGATPLPGQGLHRGWWSNPAWAKDPASRGNSAMPPGQTKK